MRRASARRVHVASGQFFHADLEEEVGGLACQRDIHFARDDLDAAINGITETVRRYVRLLRGVDTDLADLAIEAGWTQVFEQPIFARRTIVGLLPKE